MLFASPAACTTCFHRLLFSQSSLLWSTVLSRSFAAFPCWSPVVSLARSADILVALIYLLFCRCYILRGVVTPGQTSPLVRLSLRLICSYWQGC